MVTLRPKFEIVKPGPIFVKLVVDGTTYSDYLQLDVEKSIGEFNSTANFTANFNNFTGIHKDSFSLNDEVIVYAEKGVDPPTTQIFTGIIENVNPSGVANDERIIITGRDYSAVLQDMTVQPIIFKDKDAGLIARTIIINNAENKVTINNVDIATGTTLENIGFNHKSLYESLKELAELAGCYFYVDVDKDVHFELKSTISSYKKFDNKNVMFADFKTDDREIYNKVWVYGDRILTGNSQYLEADGTGSVFTLTDKPHNTRVNISGTIPTLIQPGGVFEMDDPAIKDVKWLLDFVEKQVVFTSGAVAGDNIPSAGSVYIEYERLTPILKFRQDSTSITAYGPKTKVITDNNIKSFVEANEKAVAFLAENKDPKIQGDLDIKGIIDVTPGNTCIVDLPWHGINNQTYTILSASFSFNKANCLSKKVLSISVNKKISDFADVMADQINRLRKVETGPLEGSFTTLKSVTRFIDVDSHFEVWSRGVGSAFIFGLSGHNVFNSPNALLGEMRTGSTLLESGGGF